MFTSFQKSLLKIFQVGEGKARTYAGLLSLSSEVPVEGELKAALEILLQQQTEESQDTHIQI